MLGHIGNRVGGGIHVQGRKDPLAHELLPGFPGFQFDDVTGGSVHQFVVHEGFTHRLLRLEVLQLFEQLLPRKRRLEPDQIMPRHSGTVRQHVAQSDVVDQLNDNVTLRDMLSHRTGVTRHDLIWFKSPFTRKELFEKLKYLEPQEPMRETFMYNKLMYAAAGNIIELKSGKTWEQFVRERIFAPLDMNTTTYTISDMTQHPDHGVPFLEKR